MLAYLGQTEMHIESDIAGGVGKQELLAHSGFAECGHQGIEHAAA